MAKAMLQTLCHSVLLISSLILLVSLFTAAKDGTNASDRNDMKGESTTERLEPGEDMGYKKMIAQKPKKMKPGFIYMVRMVGNQDGWDRAPRYVKVGLTENTNIAERLYSMKTANPFRLEAVATWKVTDKDPAETAAFKALNSGPQPRRAPFGGGTEWFRLLPNEENNFRHLHDTVQQAIYNAGLLDPDQTGAIQRGEFDNWDYYGA